MSSVSIIIPSYNCERFIKATLASVMAQQVDELEVLVIDDGSTDRTPEIVRGHDSRVRLIEQANAGVCRARNRGIAEARGQFICLLDHDDYWFPHKLRRQLEVMAQVPQAGVVFSSFLLWSQPEPGAPYPDPASYAIEDTPDDTVPEFSGWIYHQFLLDCWMLTSTSMFRREVFSRCGVFDESLPFSEDWDLWLRAAREVEFVQLRRPTTLYRQHARQGSGWHRTVDYRTRLLERTAARHGYASRDGRAITPGQFNRQLARYHAAYARGELAIGRRASALASYAKAWRRRPWYWKHSAYIAAALAGWRPRD